MAAATAVYWFSGTGNSYAAARDLARHLEAATFAPVVHARETANAAERTVVVFPVYAWGLPRPVGDFFDSRDAAAGRIVSVATYGGIAGAPHAEARRRLARAGLSLAAGYSVKMPENYVPFFNPPAPETARPLLEMARERIGEIADAIAREETGVYEDTPLPIRWLARPIHALSARAFPTADRRFAVTGACTGCGLCARLCPADNIALEEMRPRWKGHCEQCWACYHWCPTRAVVYCREKPDTRRYHHPEVSAADLLPAGRG